MTDTEGLYNKTLFITLSEITARTNYGTQIRLSCVSPLRAVEVACSPGLRHTRENMQPSLYLGSVSGGMWGTRADTGAAETCRHSDLFYCLLFSQSQRKNSRLMSLSRAEE